MPASLHLQGFEVIPPAGLTPGGKLHQFNRITLVRFKNVAQKIATETEQAVKRTALSEWIYPKTGRTPGRRRIIATFKGHVNASREGVGIQFSIEEMRHLEFITRMVPGNRFIAGPMEIVPKKRKYLKFYSARKGMWIRARAVTHPGFGRDLLADEISRAGRSFMIRTVNSFTKGLEDTIASMPAATIKVRRR
jgi:hypothetical protein